MPITVISGRPGAGKSMKLADKLVEILQRNIRWFDRTGIMRPVYSNLQINSKLETKFQEKIYKIAESWEKVLGEKIQVTPLLNYWVDIRDLIKTKDADIFIDEIATYFDATQWKELGLPSKRWLQQHRKLGIEIYGTAQDFSQVDIAFRRMTSDLFYLVKLIGSRDPSPTSPPVKSIWGISMVYGMSPVDYKEDQKENKTHFDSFMLISKSKVEVFDTRQEIMPGEYPALKHQERFCEDPKCTFHRVLHI